MKEKTVALVSPHHDPSGSLLKMQDQALKALKSIFDTVSVSLTSVSDGRIFRDLEYAGVHVTRREETGDIGDRYRSALRMGLEDKVDYLMLVDFDRSLHWVKYFEDELRTVVEGLKGSEGFTSFIRSERAFETHSLTQRETEVVINTIASEVVGKRVDIASGAFGMDRDTAQVLVKEISKKDFGFYGEIIAIPLRYGFQINTIDVEGLEWETPDAFKDQINTLGYTQWLNNFQSLQEWEKRLTLAFEVGQALHNN